MKHKVVFHKTSILRSKNLAVLIYLAIFFFNTSCSKEALEITTPTSSLVAASSFSSQAYSGSNFAFQPTFNLMKNGSVQTSKNYNVLLSPFSDSTCSLAAPGVLSSILNPVPLVFGIASFAGVSYTNSGHLEETIYLKATTQPGDITTCAGPITNLHKFRAGFGYSIFQPGGLSAAGNSNPFRGNYSNEIKIDSQGKIIVIGGSTNTTGDFEMVIWRYNPDGTLDSTFGNGATAGLGYVLFQNNGLNAAGGATKNEYGFGIQIDSQGRYVVSGCSRSPAGGFELAIWRYNSNGSLDTTFGNGATVGLGYVIFQAGAASASGSVGASKRDHGSYLIIDSQGRYVISGNSRNAVGGIELAIWRYNSNGSLDTTFGNGTTAGLGYVIFQAGAASASGSVGASKFDVSNGVRLDSLGRLVIAGNSKNSAGSIEPVIWRYSPSGSLDATFGSGATSGLGYVVFQANSPGAAGAVNASKDDDFYGVVIDSQDRYILVGTSKNTAGGHELAIWRYNSSGSLDPTFGNGATAGLGYVLFQAGGLGVAGATNSNKYDYAANIEIDSQGRYVMSASGINSAGGSELAVWRYNSNGSLDITFGSGATAGLGYVLFQAGGLGAAGATNSNKFDYASNIGIDSQGRYVFAGGSANPAGGNELVLWRYLPSGAVDQ